jgi:hypothetical protein
VRNQVVVAIQVVPAHAPSAAITGVILKLLLNLILYIVQCTYLSLDISAGDTLFDLHRDIDVYTRLMYHISTLVGRVLLQQPASDWLVLSAPRPGSALIGSRAHCSVRLVWRVVLSWDNLMPGLRPGKPIIYGIITTN